MQYRVDGLQIGEFFKWIIKAMQMKGYLREIPSKKVVNQIGTVLKTKTKTC